MFFTLGYDNERRVQYVLYVVQHNAALFVNIKLPVVSVVAVSFISAVPSVRDELFENEARMRHFICLLGFTKCFSTFSNFLPFP